MSDPRLNDPRFETRDPVLRDTASAGTTWAWIGGVAAVILIAILVLGNWHTGNDTGTPMTANNPSVTAPAGSPPSTTGSGTASPTSPSPMSPTPNRAPTGTPPAQ